MMIRKSMWRGQISLPALPWFACSVPQQCHNDLSLDQSLNSSKLRVVLGALEVLFLAVLFCFTASRNDPPQGSNPRAPVSRQS